jgi:D-alanyl-D-alanine carboxypeptidase (penicillin-binding protein 5/6)
MKPISLALAAALLLTTGVAAKPPVRDKKAPIAPQSPAALVRIGKRPAFFDPSDLSKPPVISATAAVLMDYDTGEILWSVNPDARRYPASTTKILTALLLIENTAPDETVTCNDANITQVGESTLHVKPGEAFPAQDLVCGFLLRSGNDAGVLIAEHVGGSVRSFAERMNARAQALGASRSHFVNPHGLHDPQHYTTAHDLAMIARAAMQNPRFEAAVREPRRVIERSINKTDRVITAKSKKLFYDRFPGADGIKTGYTRPAGHCFVGSATRDGRRLIAVALDAKVSACADVIPILSWGFRRFPTQELAPAGAVEGRGRIDGGTRSDVALTTSAPLRAARDVLGSAATARIESVLVTAPVAPGQEIGRLVAERDGREVASVPLLAAEAVPVAPLRRAGSFPLLGVLGIGTVGLLLVRYGHGILAAFGPHSARTSAKSAGRRRSRVPPPRRGDDRRRPGERRRPDRPDPRHSR